MEVQKVPGYRRGLTYFTCEENSGFYYKLKSRQNGIVYLQCVEKGCSAQAKCDETVFLTVAREFHNRLADLHKKGALLLKDDMVKKAVSLSNPVGSIFVEGNASSSVESASKLAFPASWRCNANNANHLHPTR